MRFPSFRCAPYSHESQEWSDSGVQATLSDKRRSVCNEELGIAYFEAEVLTQTDYYPFGMMMPDRQWSVGAVGYRYGFNGMERDDETYGKGNALDFGARIYDSRLGRWLSVDAYWVKTKGITPYHFGGNSPIVFVDVFGFYLVIYYQEKNKAGETQLKPFYFNGTNYSQAPKDEYVSKVLEAYKYDVSNGGGDNLKEAASNPEVSLAILNISERNNPYFTGSQYQTHTGKIYWNPEAGLLTNGGEVLSPATVLEHEAGHGKDDLMFPIAHEERVNEKDESYKNREERRVITGPESKTAKANKEIKGNLSRSSHGGILVFVLSPTSTIIDLKRTIEHYDNQQRNTPYELEDSKNRVKNHCKTGSCTCD